MPRTFFEKDHSARNMAGASALLASFVLAYYAMQQILQNTAPSEQTQVLVSLSMLSFVSGTFTLWSAASSKQEDDSENVESVRAKP